MIWRPPFEIVNLCPHKKGLLTGTIALTLIGFIDVSVCLMPVARLGERGRWGNANKNLAVGRFWLPNRAALWPILWANGSCQTSSTDYDVNCFSRQRPDHEIGEPESFHSILRRGVPRVPAVMNRPVFRNSVLSLQLARMSGSRQSPVRRFAVHRFLDIRHNQIHCMLINSRKKIRLTFLPRIACHVAGICSSHSRMPETTYNDAIFTRTISIKLFFPEKRGRS